jgi:hypothetical protein
MSSESEQLPVGSTYPDRPAISSLPGDDLPLEPEGRIPIYASHSELRWKYLEANSHVDSLHHMKDLHESDYKGRSDWPQESERYGGGTR